MKIVVSTECATCDPFKMAMQLLKASMLVHYAKEVGLECNPEFRDHFTDWVVEAEEDKGFNLIHDLRSAGCVDIHVFTGDSVYLALVENSYPGQFRVCKLNY